MTSSSEFPLPIGSIVRVREPRSRGRASKRVRNLIGSVGLVVLAYASYVAVEFPTNGTRVLFANHEVELLADDDESVE